jgi:peptide/nickel transport system permease protein
MVAFIVRRTLIGAFTIFLIGTLSFFIVSLPAGDYITSYISQLESYGDDIGIETAESLRETYGIDQPIYVQWWKWATRFVRGDFGFSLEHNKPVKAVIGDHLVNNIVLALVTALLTWVMALPIGIYSALRQNSIGDYAFTFIGYVGLAVPDFLLALVLLYFGWVYFDTSIGGLFSSEYILEPWSIGKAVDMMAHLWIPAIVLGTSGTAALIRIMRANLLDEVYKPYVITARAKGMGELKAVLKYPVRVALNPFISGIGYTLPQLVGGSVIVSVVLSLPTLGPLLLAALFSEDMHVAGAILTLLGALTIVGTLISDILLAIVDPRIRLEE